MGAPSSRAPFLGGAEEGSGRAVVWCVPRIRPPSPSKSADVSKVQGPAEEKEGRKEMEHEASAEETTKVIGSKRPLPSEDDNRPRVPRPPRVLINDQLLAESFGKRAVRKEGNGFSFRGTFYLAGLARSVVPVAHVKPSRIFSYTLYRVCAASAHIPRESVEEYAHRYATERLRPGDPVRIVQGEQRGFVATVLDINDDHADVQLKHTDLSAQIPLRLLQRVFRAGDSVVVTTGINARRWGYVVQEYAGLVTIVSPDRQDSVVVDAHIVESYDPPHHAVASVAPNSSALKLAPNLDPRSHSRSPYTQGPVHGETRVDLEGPPQGL
ncbi:hypothetical protein FOMPIDRAFT_117636 [Fomitopsis schrenkii]|uniref:KOW domain-containing protein n=1 Tax=Fomitopsis schrenkii TaxID=2126942 RepID=S8DH60_FOMSC|nr:hypothetical protein FOMPIDRAFT_117636 [Fomitopsis schrenkii]